MAFRIWGFSGCIAHVRLRLVFSFQFMAFFMNISTLTAVSGIPDAVKKDTLLPGELWKTGLLAHQGGGSSSANSFMYILTTSTFDNFQ